jgi:hypothetical protein
VTAMKIQTKRYALSALLLFPLLGAGCASTSLQGVWKAPDTGGKVNKVLVIGLTRNDTGRRALERQFVSKLSQEKTVAVDSSRYEPDGSKLTREKVEEIVKSNGFDAVILSRLVDVHREAQYVPSGYASYGGAGFYGYYGYAWPAVYSPGYVTESTNVQVETQLFRTADQGSLVWSTISQTVDPSGVDDAAEGIAGAVVNRLAEDKVL